MPRRTLVLALMGASALSLIAIMALLLAAWPAAAESIEIYEFEELTTDHGAVAVSVRADGAEAVLLRSERNDTTYRYNNTVYTTTGTTLTERANFDNATWTWTCAEFDPSSNLALLGGSSGRLYTYENGRVALVTTGISYTIYAIAWDHSDSVAYLGTSSSYLYQYRSGSFARLTSYSSVFDLSVHPDGGTLAVAMSYNYVYLYNITFDTWTELGQPVDDQNNYYYYASTCEWASNGRSLLANWYDYRGNYAMFRYVMDSNKWDYIAKTAREVRDIMYEVEGSFTLLAMESNLQYLQGGSVMAVPDWYLTGATACYDTDYNRRDLYFLLGCDNSVWKLKRKPNVRPWLDQPIPDVTIDEDDADGGDNVIDLMNYVRDDRMFSKLRFEFEYQQNESILAGVVDGQYLDFHQKVEHWNGRMQFQIRIWDMGFDDKPDTLDDDSNTTNVFNVTVRPINDPVSLISIGELVVGEDVLVWFVDEGQTLSLDIVTTDVDNVPPGRQPPSFSFNRTLPSLRVDTGTMKLVFQPRNKDVGTVRLNITVSDGFGSSDFAHIVFQVRNVNNPARLVALKDLTVKEDEWLNFTVSARDEDLDININDTLTFSTNVTDGVGDDDLSLFSFAREDRTRIKVSFLPLNKDVGVIHVEFRVRDNHAPLGTWQDVKSMKITVENTNDAPVMIEVDGISTTTLVEYPVTATEDVRMTVDLLADDDDRDLLTFYVDDSRFALHQPGLGYEAELSFTPGNSDVGTLLVTVSVWDVFNAFDELVLNITVINVNDAPEIISFEAKDATGVDELEFLLFEDVPFSAPVRAVDIDSPVLVFSDSGLLFTFEVFEKDPFRTWANLTPTQDQVGYHETTLEVNDKDGGKATLLIKLTVMNVNDPPSSVNVVQLDINTMDIPLQADKATDPDGDVLTYTWDFGDHSEVVSDANLTSVSHTYARPGIYGLVLTITDGNGGSSVSTLDVIVPDLGDGKEETEVEPGPVSLVVALIVAFAVLVGIILYLYWKLPTEEE